MTRPDMTRPLFFSDLDDTIFQTERKLSGEVSQATLAARALNDRHSYMSASQSAMMDWLLSSTRFIPVTARSTEALQRCTLPFADYQICTNGAVILLPDGSADQDWHSTMAREAKNAEACLKELLNFVKNKAPPSRFRCWIVEEFGTGFYFCVKSNEGAARLDEIDSNLSHIAGSEWVRHRNENNLSFTPPGISKQRAVLHLSGKILSEKHVPVFGMGDSLTDLPFMSTCDMLVVPSNSQIARNLLHIGKK